MAASARAAPTVAPEISPDDVEPDAPIGFVINVYTYNTRMCCAAYVDCVKGDLALVFVSTDSALALPDLLNAAGVTAWLVVSSCLLSRYSLNMLWFI